MSRPLLCLKPTVLEVPDKLAKETTRALARSLAAPFRAKARAFDRVVARTRGNNSRKIVVTERWLLSLIGKTAPKAPNWRGGAR